MREHHHSACAHQPQEDQSTWTKVCPGEAQTISFRANSLWLCRFFYLNKNIPCIYLHLPLGTQGITCSGLQPILNLKQACSWLKLNLHCLFLFTFPLFFLFSFYYPDDHEVLLNFHFLMTMMLIIIYCDFLLLFVNLLERQLKHLPSLNS